MSSTIKNFTINDTGYLGVISGTTAQRPTAVYSTVGSGQTWTAPPGVTSVAVLVVAGGGAGGSGNGTGSNGTGGGGAGGVVYNSSYTVVPGNNYSITVGAGGTASSGAQGSSGGNSVFDTITAIGGGGGGASNTSNINYNGVNGGSGGGASSFSTVGTAGTGTAGQGAGGGGASNTSPVYGGGGGGGSAAIGTAGTSTLGGAGGAGTLYSISGVPTYYAGGGGGGSFSSLATVGVGGSGGGGFGGYAAYGQPGSANTGGGGGGTSGTNLGGAGGSGIVIISWLVNTGGLVRYNSSNKQLETYSGNRDVPSLGATKWSSTGTPPGGTISGFVSNGLVCLLDAGDPKSYPGSGKIWYDISGNNRHFYINSTYTTWNSAGTASYFNCPGTNSIGDFSSYAFTGPPSDTWNFGQEHTIDAVTNVTAAQTNWFFYFSGTPKNNYYSSSRLSCHFVYGGANSYYDVHGCCDANSRTVYPNSDRDFVGAIRNVTWRTRTSEVPYRQMFRNGVSVVDSQGAAIADTMIWNRKDPALLCGGWNGRVYFIAIYNRALTDTERAANYAVLQARYGL